MTLIRHLGQARMQGCKTAHVGESHLKVLWHLAIFLAVQCEQRLLVIEEVHPLRPCSRPPQQISTCTSPQGQAGLCADWHSRHALGHDSLVWH